MAGKLTFTMIKPTAFKNNYAGPILKMINEAGFVIKAMKLTRLTFSQAVHFTLYTKESRCMDRWSNL